MGNDGKNSRVWLALILFGALALRLGLFLYVSPKPLKLFTPDSFGYDQIATNMLRYGVFSINQHPPFTAELDRTPGYPAMLVAIYALMGHTPEVVVLVQLFLGTATAGLTYLLSRILRLSPAVGLGAALVVALDPVSVMTSNLLLSDTLFTTLLVAGAVFLALHWRSQRLGWLLAGAALLGLAAVTRPVSQFLPLILVPLVAASKSGKGRRAAAIAVILFLGVSLGITYSWAYRNYREGGLFTLSTVADTNLVYYRAREVLASVEGVSQPEALRRLEARVAQAGAGKRLTPAEVADLERVEALDIFREHPVATVAMEVKGAVRIFIDPGFTNACTLLDPNSTDVKCFEGEAVMNEQDAVSKALARFVQMNPLQQLTLIWSGLLSAGVYIGAVLGLIHLGRERRFFAASLLIVVVGYLVLVSAGAEAYSRFRIPMVPFLSVLAVVGLGGIWRYLLGTRGGRSAVSAIERVS